MFSNHLRWALKIQLREYNSSGRNYCMFYGGNEVTFFFIGNGFIRAVHWMGGFRKNLYFGEATDIVSF